MASFNAIYSQEPNIIHQKGDGDIVDCMYQMQGFASRLAWLPMFVRGSNMQILLLLSEEGARRKRDREVCTRCSRANTRFTLTNIKCDGQCGGTDIEAHGQFDVLEGAVDTHYCPVSQQ